MTTAHRATYVSARGLGVGSEGSYSTGGVNSAAFSAKDLPSQLSLKRREDDDLNKTLTKKELKQQLEERERNAQEQRAAGKDASFTKAITNHASSSSSSTTTNNIPASVTLALSDKYNIDDDDNILKLYDDDDDDDDDDNKVSGKRKRGEDDDDDDDDDDSDEDSSDDDDDELELLRELQKIKAEREQEAQRKKDEASSVSEISAEVASSNPLLGGGTASGSIQRRWDDDVVFRNQAPGDPTKVKKKFVNDTIRNSFHKRFLKKYIN